MSKLEVNPLPTNSMKRKLFIVVFLIILLMAGYICVRLFDTAVIKSEHYRAKANDQQLRDIIIPANRGTIYDRNGKILAQSQTVWKIVISPTTIRENSELYQSQRTNAAMREYRAKLAEGIPALMPVDGTVYNEAEEICRALARIFDLDYEALLKRMMESELGYEEVKRQVEKAEVDLLNEFKLEKGIGTFSVYALEDTKRIYPNGSLAASVIGFTNNYDNIGMYGIEARYDKYLQGVDGRFQMMRDANNQAMPYDYEKRHEAQNGNSLILTIDEVLQHYLEKNLEIAVSQHKPENRATGIIMNAQTGAILAMGTYPSFNLNQPWTLSDLDYSRLDELREQKINDALIINGLETGTEANLTTEQIARIDSDITQAHVVMRETQWKNKAISELYNPGSVFKVITLAAALEEHVVSYESEFYCGGYIMIAGEKINCWDSRGHGQISGVTYAITKSCNPAFIEIGRRLGTDTFSDYFDAFGLTRRTGIDLPAESISVFRGRNTMSTLDLSVSSIGQVNKITPLQMITAYAAAINGGHLVTPYVVEKIIDNDGNVVHSAQPQIRRQVISAETSALMRQILEDVVNENGGNNAYIAGYRIGGKSGTSQKIDEFPEGDRYVASFGAFTPANEPEIIMLVMVDDPLGGQIYGSMVAAPVVSEVFKEALPYLKIFQTQPESTMQNVIVPYLTGLTAAEAAERLRIVGLQYRFEGAESGNTVLRTVPFDGQAIAMGGTVTIYMAEEDYTKAVVPNVIGLNPARANEALTNAGLNIRLSGGAVNNDRAEAFLQSIEPGEEVAAGTVVEVEFRVFDGHAG